MKTIIGSVLFFFSVQVLAQDSGLMTDLASGKTIYTTVQGLHQLSFVDLKNQFQGEISPVSFSEVYKDEMGLSCRVFGSFASEKSALRYFEGSKLNWKVDKDYDNGVIPPYQFITQAQMKNGLALKLAPSSLQYSKSMSKPCLEWADDGMFCDDQSCWPKQKCVTLGQAQIKHESVSFALGLEGKRDLDVSCSREIDTTKVPGIPDLQLNDMNLLRPIIDISVE